MCICNGVFFFVCEPCFIAFCGSHCHSYIIFLVAYIGSKCTSCSFQQKHKQISQTKIRVTSVILFILAGCIVFVTIPAVIFKHIEGWTTLDAIYFVVITLTTVGIGDYVAGRATLQNLGTVSCSVEVLGLISDHNDIFLPLQVEIARSTT